MFEDTNISGVIFYDVSHRITVGRLKWRGASIMLCDKHIPLELKGKFYKTDIRPTMLYGVEC